MTETANNAARWRAALLAATLVAGGGGYWLGGRHSAPLPASASGAPQTKILYYYDPMLPQEHYDNPNSLSSMGMKTQPKYAEEGGAVGETTGIKINPNAMQLSLIHI